MPLQSVTVRVPATAANLGPGFDSLGIALCLYNHVTLEVSQADSIEVSGEGAGSLPRDKSNIAAKAVAEVFGQTGRDRPALHLRLENEIPLARGLGSSAAARVGAILAARHFLEGPTDPPSLIPLAASLEGHPDNVAPALLGGLIVVAEGKEGIHWSQAPLSPAVRFVVAVPEFEVSTQKARQALPESVPFEDAVFNLQRTALLVTALGQGQGALIGRAMEDRLHQPHRAHLMGPLEEVFRAAREAGAAGVALSGAGPSVLALSTGGDGPPKTIGEAMREVYKSRGIKCRSLILDVDREGAKILAEEK